jgi:hypothetical protein
MTVGVIVEIGANAGIGENVARGKIVQNPIEH